MLAAFGLAACGGGGGGTGGTGDTGTMPMPMPMPDPDPDPMEQSALEKAIELDGRLADVDVDALQEGAIENAGKLTAESVKGDSAMAEANADAILKADADIRQAVMDAEAVITEATAAKEAAEAIEDAAEKAAVMRFLDDAIEKATAIKTDGQGHIDEEGTTDAVETLGEAVAVVTGGADADPQMTAANAGEAVAATVRTALASVTTGNAGDAPMGAIRNDSADIGAMTWAMIVGEANVMDVRQLVSGDISEVKAMSVGGSMGSDLLAANASLPGDDDAGTDGIQNGDGDSFNAMYKGIAGTVFCGGSDCGQDADGNLTGSWYFTPALLTELYVANPAMMGSYMIATMYARYGYWLTYTDGGASGVSTHAAAGHSDDTNTADLDLMRGDDATADVTASYSGHAVGIAVRNKASGEFTADVSLTATFGATAGNTRRPHLELRWRRSRSELAREALMKPI